MKLILIGAAILILYLVMIAPRFPRKKKRAGFCGRLYAHRGLFNNQTGVPENSMPAFSLAVKHRYGIEFDVQVTKDDKIVVFHDNTLSRMCGIDLLVMEKTYEELLELPLLNTEEKIPLLSEVLSLVNGQVPLLIEIKLPILNTHVCELINNELLNYSGPYCIESFNTMALWWYKRHRPEIIRGQLSADLTHPVADGGFLLCFLVKYLMTNFLAKPDFISYCYKDTKNISYQLNKHVFRASTFAWTIDSPKAYADTQGKFDSYIFEGFQA